ncbi:MAG TPA: type IV pilin N-terminal domain-containing protein, partial [Candidatus Thermoplasmatota archaeon]|nr:type IV pilin N-terminal domain-containing protein [Candidatus Thermoplasmatota archaeon]
MSEVVATTLLVAITAIILGGFAVVVLSTVTDTAETSPVGSFTMAAAPGDRALNLTFLSGTSIPLGELRVVVTVNGTMALAEGLSLSGGSDAVWHPGERLRVNLTDAHPALGAGTGVTVSILHAPTDTLVGQTSLTIMGALAATPLWTAQPGVVAATVTPRPITADGVALGTLAVAVRHEYGRDFVKTVTVNLTPLGGLAAVTLLDDGQGPDAVPGDGIYSAEFNVPTAALISNAYPQTT